MSDKPRHAYLDALRGWAILLVLLIHASQGQFAFHALGRLNPAERSDLDLPAALSVICGAGGDGVVLFFVVSALSLTISARKQASMDLRAYALRRFFRIAPMYYCGVALYLTLFGWGPRLASSSGVNAADIVANLTFTHGFRDSAINSVVPGGWSVAAEAIFYVLLPSLLYLLIRAPKTWGLVAGLSIVLSTTYRLNVFGAYQLGPMAAFYPMNYLPGFAFGLVAGLWIARAEEKAIKASAGPTSAVAQLSKFDPAALLFALVCVAPLIAAMTTLPAVPQAFNSVKIALTAMLGALLCLRLHGAERPNLVVVNIITQRLGVVSFSIYITHFALLSVIYDLAGRITTNRGVMFLAIYYLMLVSGSFAVANVTYELIERPFIRVSRRLASALTRLPTPLPVVGLPLAGPAVRTEQTR